MENTIQAFSKDDWHIFMYIFGYNSYAIQKNNIFNDIYIKLISTKQT